MTTNYFSISLSTSSCCSFFFKKVLLFHHKDEKRCTDQEVRQAYMTTAMAKIEHRWRVSELFMRWFSAPVSALVTSLYPSCCVTFPSAAATPSLSGFCPLLYLSLPYMISLDVCMLPGLVTSYYTIYGLITCIILRSILQTSIRDGPFDHCSWYRQELLNDYYLPRAKTT